MYRILAIVAIVTLGLAGGTARASCDGDFDGDGQVTIDEILVSVNNSLNGCTLPQPTVTPATPSTSTPTRVPSPTRTPSVTRTVTRTPTPTPRFVDNGNGTITDTSTGLMWAKKDQSAGIHDVDNTYTWTATYPASPPNGTLFTTYIATLNAGNFAGHNDWRLPTRDELATIVDRGAIQPGQPAVDPVFNTNCVSGCRVTQCSCTKALNYWTSTSAATVQYAWYVLFNTGESGTGLKTLGFYARAVRSGG